MARKHTKGATTHKERDLRRLVKKFMWVENVLQTSDRSAVWQEPVFSESKTQEKIDDLSESVKAIVLGCVFPVRVPVVCSRCVFPFCVPVLCSRSAFPLCVPVVRSRCVFPSCAPGGAFRVVGSAKMH